jgi:hypothetical protein
MNETTRGVHKQPATTVANPYWEEIERTGLPDRDRSFSRFDVDRELSFIYARDNLTVKYSWAISDPVTVRFVARWLAPRAVEMGAGTGYWAWLMRQSGVDMLAYDKTPASSGKYNHWHTPRDPKTGKPIYQPMPSYSEVLPGKPAILSQHTDRTLFLCWPPYDDLMAADCLAAYAGKRVVYIGESDGGCTADDAFHEALEAGWELRDEHWPKQWHGIHDWVWVYERQATAE